MLFIVNYSINSQTRGPQGLVAALNALGDARLQIFGNTWLLHTVRERAVDIQRVLQMQIDPADRVFVAEITHMQRNGWMNRNVWEWANQHDN